MDTPTGRGWPGNLTRVRRAAAGLPALVAGFVGAIDSAASAGMSGRTGTIIAGDGADPAYSFRGYLAYRATAALPVGAQTTLIRGPYTALPSTASADVRYLSEPGRRVMDVLATMTPGGAR